MSTKTNTIKGNNTGTNKTFLSVKPFKVKEEKLQGRSALSTSTI